jgi:DNA-binding response OmpR family regulator
MSGHGNGNAKIGEGRTVLLVDDDPDFLESTGMFLSSLGFEVTRAASVSEGSERFGESRPDLAVLDLMLDEPDGGFVLCHLIKKQAPEVPVLVCSAVKSETGMDFGASSEAERRWVKADAWLPKPIRFEELSREVARLMGAT